MKGYQSPNLEILKISTADIIATSGVERDILFDASSLDNGINNLEIGG